MRFCPFVCYVLLLSFLSQGNLAAQEIDEARMKELGWIKMFNGENLEGWTPKIKGYPVGENYANTFRAEDGVLKVRYDQYEGDFKGRFGHLFYNQTFSNYIMRMEYRFVGEQAPGGPGWALRNSGIMIHGQAPETMGLNQDFPVSIEVQLLSGFDAEPRQTMNLCTPGTNVVMNGELFKKHCVRSNSPTYRGDGWVSCEIEVRGNGTIRHRVEGQTVMEYSGAQLDPRDEKSKKLIVDGNLQLSGGTISLQGESHGCEFRNVWIREIPAAEKDE